MAQLTQQDLNELQGRLNDEMTQLLRELAQLAELDAKNLNEMVGLVRRLAESVTHLQGAVTGISRRIDGMLKAKDQA